MDNSHTTNQADKIQGVSGNTQPAPQSFGSGGSGGIGVIITRPDNIVTHIVSNEQLNQLTTNNTDANWMYTFIGSAIGSLPSTASTMFDYYKDTKSPIEPINLITTIVFFIVFALAICCFFFSSKQKKQRQNLITEIRAREKTLNS